MNHKEVSAIRRRRFVRRAPEPRTRVNERITALELRVIDEDGTQLGVLSRDAALERAMDKGLDLVEVAEKETPPVCRIMDHSKFLYEQKRKQKQSRRNAHHQDTKEIQLRPNIDTHDFEIKMKRARDFLEKGHKIKVALRYRRREMRHYEIGIETLERMIQDLSDLSHVEIKHQGGRARLQICVLAPDKQPTAKQPTEKKPPTPTETTKEPAEDA